MCKNVLKWRTFELTGSEQQMMMMMMMTGRYDNRSGLIALYIYAQMTALEETIG